MQSCGSGGRWRLSKKIDFNVDDKQTGLKGALFSRKLENGKVEYAYVFAGTEDGKDGINDGQQLIGTSKQYADALDIANKLTVYLKMKELTFIGHSLGG
jgi:hypothetical protein